MNTTKTIIRFLIIVIFLILLVFLSIFLFKLIPAGINQLATSSLSLTGSNISTSTNNNQPAATTTGGLNGVITQNLGDIKISEPKPLVTNTSNTTRIPTKIVYVDRPVYYSNTVSTNLNGLKNIRTNLTTTGIINRFSGQFIATNSFNTNDTVSVKYRISNDEDTATGPFSMRVEMPALNSNDQVKFINNINIPARSSYDVEARFDGINTLNNTPTVRIFTDVNNQVSETNESDNNLFVSLNNVFGNNNNNNYNCNYYNNCNNNFGNANLTIVSAQTGRFINGVFFAQNTFNTNETVFIQLRVRNTGGSFTNTWSTRTTYIDQNGSFRERTTTGERYLSSGEETNLTYSIPNINRGNTTLNINIDSNNNIFETNENDNTSSLVLFMN